MLWFVERLKKIDVYAIQLRHKVIAVWLWEVVFECGVFSVTV